MNDVQNELERLRAEVAQLKKALSDRQLPATPNLPALRDNLELVVDCARYAEGLVSEQSVRKKYGFSEETWERLGNDDALVERIEAEKLRRVRDGSFKREKAQQLVTKAPDVLSAILLDEKTSPKHRIDASKTLDAFAANGPQAAAEQDRVVITINLGADERLRFNKSIAVDPNDSDPETMPQELLPIIAANRRTDDGNGNPL
jgi:hypothetical protein